MTMKKILAVLLTVALTLTALTGCGCGGTSGGGGDSDGIVSETVKLPEYPAPFIAQQNVTAIAAQQYITARLYLEALIEFDWDADTVEEFAELYDGTIEQFDLAEEYAGLAVQTADLAQEFIDAGGGVKTAGAAAAAKTTASVGSPFVLTAYAADEPKRTADELRAWAKDVEKAANDASQVYGEKGVVGTLAKQFGVDSKTAGEMLKQAKTINEGASAESAAYWWGLGADAAAVMGLITLDYSKIDRAALLVGESGKAVAGVIGYIGNSLIDLPESKVMGVTMESLETLNAITLMACSYATTGEAVPQREVEIKKISEQLNENRVKQGLPPIPETTAEPKPPIEKAKETAPKVPVKSVEEYISELIDWMEDISYISPEFAEELRAKYLGGGTGNFEGMYSGTTNETLTIGGEPNAITGSCTIVLSLTDEASGTYSINLDAGVPRTAIAVIKTDGNTGTASFDATFYDEDGGLTLHFTINNGKLEAAISEESYSPELGDFSYSFSISATKQ